MQSEASEKKELPRRRSVGALSQQVLMSMLLLAGITGCESSGHASHDDTPSASSSQRELDVMEQRARWREDLSREDEARSRRFSEEFEKRQQIQALKLNAMQDTKDREREARMPQRSRERLEEARRLSRLPR